jgi:rsbT co-antagonist protein RsbR
VLNYLIIPFVVFCSILLTYVFMQDPQATANRLFAIFMANVLFQLGTSVVRLTTHNQGLALVTSMPLGITLALNQLLLVWLIMALFIPDRYAQTKTRWLIAAPYLVSIAALALDFIPGASLWLGPIHQNIDGTYSVRALKISIPLVAGLTISQIVPVIMLATIAVRNPDRRAPAIILAFGSIATTIMSSLPQAQAIPLLYALGAIPTYLAFAWATLRYQLFRPSNVALQAAIESIPDGILFLDQHQHIRYANTAARQLLWLNGNTGITSWDEVRSAAAFVESRQHTPAGESQIRLVRNTQEPMILEGEQVAISGDTMRMSVVTLRNITGDEQRQAELQKALGEVEARASEQTRLREEIEQQREAIRELGVPVLPVSTDTMVMPLVGVLDAVRLEQVQQQALRKLQESRARRLILDITGVPIVDSFVAQGLLRVVQAARLLGSDVTLVGIRPEVAQTIVGLGLSLEGMRTQSSLRDALSE